MITYLCLDDMPDDVRIATERLSVRGLRINLDSPTVFKTQLSLIAKKRKGKEIDGLILDLRLNDSAEPGKRPVDYKAQNLAGALRNKMAEGKVRDFPIVLWSISQKFAKSYDKDLTSHDLFDVVIDKEDLHDPARIIEFAKQLLSLAKAFELVAEQSKGKDFWRSLLKVPEEVMLDPRMGQDLQTSRSKSPTHILARYLLKEIVEVPGPLVNQSMLCARLGISEDSFRSSSLFRELAPVALYTGPYSEAWPRWWWAAVEKWWRKLDVTLPSILSLTADQRVKQFGRAGFKRLKTAQPIDNGYSTRFTTICQHTQRPLDPIDGFMLNAAGLEPWQDREYVSRDVAMRPGFHQFRGQLDSLEVERLKSARKALQKKPHG